MNDAAAESLRVDPVAIERLVRFYRAYAVTCQREWEQVTNSAGHDRVHSRTDDRLMELASALRQAGAWSLLVDTRAALDLLRSAAQAFIQMGFGYGAFLGAATSATRAVPEPLSTDDDEFLDTLLNFVTQIQLGDEVGVDMPEAIRHPQQQVYAVIAACGATPRARNLAHGIAERAEQRNGVLPVGALGTPIRRFWAVATGLLVGDVRTTLAHIAAMNDRFSDASESAMVTGALWATGQAGFEAIDLDIIGLTVLAIRTFGRDRTIGAIEEQRVFDGTVGRSQMLIAIDIVDVLDQDDRGHP